MRIKGLKCIKLVNSRGFLIPVEYTEDRMDDGLQIGRIYDLEIIEVKEEEAAP
jgi:hypothetical protein